jgi:hypothetical protein
VDEVLTCRYCQRPIDLRRDSYVMLCQDTSPDYDRAYLAAHFTCYEAQGSPEAASESIARHPG